MTKRMDMNTQHGECFLRLRKPCRHCKEVERREHKRWIKDYPQVFKKNG